MRYWDGWKTENIRIKKFYHALLKIYDFSFNFLAAALNHGQGVDLERKAGLAREVEGK